jgi:hypothetical protein
VPVVESKKVKERKLKETLHDLKAGDIVSISPTVPIWFDDLYTGVKLDNYAAENRSVALPEVDDPNDYDVIRKAVIEGKLVLGTIVYDDPPIRTEDIGIHLTGDIDDLKEAILTMAPGELEALHQKELNGHRRQKYLEAIRNAIEKYAIELTVIDIDNKKEVYVHIKPAKEGNTRARVGEPEDHAVATKGKPDIELGD